jgi:hypothetical protein
MIDNSNLEWRGDRLCWRGREYARLEPDATGMWRVQASGRLSDMANRTRARDAARSTVLGILKGRQTPSEAA